MGTTQSMPKITQHDKAILDLKLQRDKLKVYQQKIQTVLGREQEIAKQQLRAGQKDRALVALRRRKYQESLLLKTDNQLESLEQLVSTIEFSLVQSSVLHGLKEGNEVLKQIHKEMNLESVEKLLEETAEAQAYQKEIDEMLVSTLSLDEEEAVQAELQELQAEAETELPRPAKLPSVPGKLVELPAVPKEELGKKTKVGAQTAEEHTRVALEA